MFRSLFILLQIMFPRFNWLIAVVDKFWNEILRITPLTAVFFSFQVLTNYNS